MSAAQSACTARNPNMQWRPRRKKLPAPEHGKRLEDLWSQGASSMSDDDVDAAFRQLIEETLPPDKQDALMETYEAESDPRMRYNMLLEFSSYLRQARAPHPPSLRRAPHLLIRALRALEGCELQRGERRASPVKLRSLPSQVQAW